MKRDCMFSCCKHLSLQSDYDTRLCLTLTLAHQSEPPDPSQWVPSVHHLLVPLSLVPSPLAPPAHKSQMNFTLSGPSLGIIFKTCRIRYKLLTLLAQMTSASWHSEQCVPVSSLFFPLPLSHFPFPSSLLSNLEPISLSLFVQFLIHSFIKQILSICCI